MWMIVLDVAQQLWRRVRPGAGQRPAADAPPAGRAGRPASGAPWAIGAVLLLVFWWQDRQIAALRAEAAAHDVAQVHAALQGALTGQTLRTTADALNLLRARLAGEIEQNTTLGRQADDILREVRQRHAETPVDTVGCRPLIDTLDLLRERPVDPFGDPGPQEPGAARGQSAAVPVAPADLLDPDDPAYG